MKDQGQIKGFPITNVEIDTQEDVINLYSGKFAIAEGRNIRFNEKAIKTLQRKKIRRAKIRGVVGKVGAGLGITSLIAAVFAGLVILKDFDDDFKTRTASELEIGQNIIMEMVKTPDGQDIIAAYLDDVLNDVSYTIDNAEGRDVNGWRLFETDFEKALSDAAITKQKAREAKELGETDLAEQYTIDYAGRLTAAANEAATNGMIIGVGDYEGYKDAKMIDDKLYMVVDTKSLTNGVLPKGSILIDNVLYAPTNPFESNKSLS